MREYRLDLKHFRKSVFHYDNNTKLIRLKLVLYADNEADIENKGRA